ncbi:kinase-like protein, partial [Calocera viscosa TUFC12733]
LLDIIDGVSYLHSHPSAPIIHGDLKGVSGITGNNILIDFDVTRQRQTARLIDFGLSHIMEADMEHEAATTSTATSGNARWLAFERFDPEQYGLRQSESRTTKSDVFELTRTIFEILTGGPPFQGMPDYRALNAVLRGSNPERPDGCRWIDDDRWNLMLKCWSPDRDARPSLDALRQDIDQSIWLDLFLVSSRIVPERR